MRLNLSLLGSFSVLGMLVACGAPDAMVNAEDPAADETPALGEADQALTSCDGPDDSNSLAAGLAVAIANELGRWEVNTDFVVSNGKLQLSTTGQLHCSTGCTKINALLQMQDDASSVVPDHSPAAYRSKLSNWYAQQQQELTDMVHDMLQVDEGVFQIRSKVSGKLLVPQNGSASSEALIQQSDQFGGSNASQWRVVLNGTLRQVINIKSGMCLDLQSNTTGATNTVQRACNGSSTQGFRLAQLSGANLSIRSATNQALQIPNSSTANGVNVVQGTVAGLAPEQFQFVASGGGVHEDLLETATAVYSLKFKHSGMGLAVASSSMSDGVAIVQQPYSASDDRFHWYVTQIGSANVNGVTQTTYQFLNRRTGKCMDLADSSIGTRLVQRTCSTSNTQRFLLTPTGGGHQVAFTYHGYPAGIQNGSTSSGAQLVEANVGWQYYNMMMFEPILAGEPHRLSYAKQSTGGPCGKYDWYNITQPNGLAVENPNDTFVQLMFAGGKQTASGTDVNPYIAQKVSGTQVAIDPTYGLDAEDVTSTGACVAACVSVKASSLAGQCCSCRGITKAFKQASWNASTFICL